MLRPECKVLGVQVTETSLQVDLNSYISPGQYVITAQAGSSNVPIAIPATFYLEVKYAFANRRIQTIVTYNNNEIYERVKTNQGAWSDWQRIDNFGCRTPADLASLLGGVTIIIASGQDLNTMTKQGVIYISPSGATSTSLSNRPSDLIEAFILFAPVPTMQIFITNWSELHIYKRSYDGGRWQKWQKIVGTAVEYAE